MTENKSVGSKNGCESIHSSMAEAGRKRRRTTDDIGNTAERAKQVAYEYIEDSEEEEEHEKSATRNAVFDFFERFLRTDDYPNFDTKRCFAHDCDANSAQRKEGEKNVNTGSKNDKQFDNKNSSWQTKHEPDLDQRDTGSKQRNAGLTELQLFLRDAEIQQLKNTINVKNAYISDMANDHKLELAQHSTNTASKDSEINELTKKVCNKNALMANMRKELIAQNSTISEMKNEIKRKLEEHTTIRSSKDAEIHELANKVCHKDFVIAHLKNSLSAKIAKLSKLKNARMLELENHAAQVASKDAKIQDFADAIHDKDYLIGKMTSIHKVEVDRLSAQCVAMSTHAKKMEEEEAKCRHDMENLRSETKGKLDSKYEEILRLTTEIDEVQSCLSNKDQALAHLSTEVERHMSTVTELRGYNKVISTELCKMRSLGLVKDRELAQISTEVEEQAKAIKKLQGDIGVISMLTVSELQTFLQELESRVKDVREVMFDKEVEIKVRLKSTKLEAAAAKAREERMCAVCLDGDLEIRLSCGHLLCRNCADCLKECPQCRKRISSRKRVYM